MARWAPCKRKIFISKLMALGSTPAEPGGRHFYMRYGEHTMTVSNNQEFSVPQLKMLLKEVEHILEKEVSLEKWQEL